MKKVLIALVAAILILAATILYAVNKLSGTEKATQSSTTAPHAMPSDCDSKIRELAPGVMYKKIHYHDCFEQSGIFVQNLQTGKYEIALVERPNDFFLVDCFVPDKNQTFTEVDCPRNRNR